MASVQTTDSQTFRSTGNIHFKTAHGSGLAPVLRKYHLQQAISYYDKAIRAAGANNDLLSSGHKNHAKTAYQLAVVIWTSDQNFISSVFYYKEAILHFSQALEFGKNSRDHKWIEDLKTSYLFCVEKAIELCSCNDIKRRASSIESFIQVIQDNDEMKAELHKELATVLFHHAIGALSKNDYKTSLYYLKECYHPIQELFKSKNVYMVSEATVLEQDVDLHMASAESLQAIATGDVLMKHVLRDEEELNMDMVYTVIDHYKTAIALAREKEVQTEAMACSRLGNLYNKILKITHRAKNYFTLCMHLAHSMTPRSFTTEDWFQVAATSLQKIQEASFEFQEAKKRAERQKYLDEMKDVLEALDDARKKYYDNAEYLIHIYKTHPPKNALHKLPEDMDVKIGIPALKKLYQKAVIHYHPDKINRDEDTKLYVLCEEITKRLTQVYEHLKF